MATPPVELLPVVVVPIGGVQPEYNEAEEQGHYVPINSGNTILHVKNGNVADVALIIAGGAVPGSGRYLQDREVTIGDGEEKFIRLSKFDDLGGEKNGQSLITFDPYADVTFAVIG